LDARLRISNLPAADAEFLRKLQQITHESLYYTS
jgi:hypothetical protein